MIWIQKFFCRTHRYREQARLQTELGVAYLFKAEKEVAMPGKISSEDVLGATLTLENDKEFGYSIPNPGRKIRK